MFIRMNTGGMNAQYVIIVRHDQGFRLKMLGRCFWRGNRGIKGNKGYRGNRGYKGYKGEIGDIKEGTVIVFLIVYNFNILILTT